MTENEEHPKSPDTSQHQQNKPEDSPEIRHSEEINPEELAKQAGEKDIAQIHSELLKGQQFAVAYMDFRSGGVYFSGDTKITGDVVGRDQEKTQGSQRVRVSSKHTANSIPGTQISKVANTYVKTVQFEDAKSIISSKNVLFIRGEAHLGKCTTAIYLLNLLHENSIYELDPSAEVDLLTFDSKTSCGYIIDTYSFADIEKFSAYRLHEIQKQLIATSSHLIITVDNSIILPIEVFRGFFIGWVDIPSKHEQISKLLSYQIADADVQEKVFKLLNAPEVVQILEQRLLPGQTEQLVFLLVDSISKNIPLSNVLDRFKACAEDQVNRWFESHKDEKDIIFFLSVALFNGASIQTIQDAERRLYASLPQSEGSQTTTSSIFGTSLSHRLGIVNARIHQGYEETEFGRNPIDIIELNNPALQPVILEYVWKEFYTLQEYLVNWIRDSAINSTFDKRIRASAAAGGLLRLNFGCIKSGIITPWATHSDSRVRASAAYALGVPAWDSEKAPLVLGLLHHWCTLENYYLCWTAAAAYGSLVGLRFPDAAFRDLLILAKTGDLRLMPVVTQSIFNLFNFGEEIWEYRDKVINELVGWTEKPKSNSSIIGLFIFLFLVDNARTKAIPDQDYWPALLWMLEDGNQASENIVLLWRRAINSQATRSIATHSLRAWLSWASKDTRLFKNLLWLLNQVIENGEKREIERIGYYLEMWKDEPEIDKVAKDLITALLAE